MKKVEETNFRKYDTGIISFTRDNSWLSGTVITDHGWGNGYVGVPEDHYLFGREYYQLSIDIHGGLTYSKFEVFDGVTYWVLGFDTNHYEDNKTNCTESYVLEQIDHLYAQILAYRETIAIPDTIELLNGLNKQFPELKISWSQ